MTQIEEVRKYLRNNHSITSVEAYEMFGITRLSDIIFKLRNMGYKIQTVSVKGKNRYGRPCYYARYTWYE